MKIFYFFLIWSFILSVIGLIYILIKALISNRKYIEKLWEKDSYEADKFAILFEIYKMVTTEEFVRSLNEEQIECVTLKLGEIVSLDEKILIVLSELGELK